MHQRRSQNSRTFLPGQFSRRRSLVLIFCTMLLLSGCGAVLRFKVPLEQTPDDVPMSGRNPAREFTDRSSFTFPLSMAWEYDASSGFGNGSPVIVGNTLIFGTMQGELHAVDMTTGKRLRYMKNFSPIASSPAVFRHIVIFGLESSDENLIAVNTEDGEVMWMKDAGGVAASPLVKDDRLYVGGLNGALQCMNPISGTEKWRAETGASIRSSPCASADLIFCANVSGDVFAFSAADGTQQWKFSAGNAVFAGLTVHDGKLYVGSRDSIVYILNASTGAVERKIMIGNKIMSAPSVSNGIVYVPSLDGSVSAYTISDGNLLWKFRSKSAVNTTPVITPDAIIVASLDQHFYALSPMDGTVLWKHHLESRIKTTPLVWKNSIIISAEDKNIYCFR